MPEATATSIDLLFYKLLEKVPKKPFCYIHPNVATLLGFFCIPFILANIHNNGTMVAGVGIILLKSFLDILDGKLARRCDKTSDIGHTLDHLSDLMFYQSIFIYLLYLSFIHRRPYHSLIIFLIMTNVYKYVVELHYNSDFINPVFRLFHDNSMLFSPIFMIIVKIYVSKIKYV